MSLTPPLEQLALRLLDVGAITFVDGPPRILINLRSLSAEVIQHVAIMMRQHVKNGRWPCHRVAGAQPAGDSFTAAFCASAPEQIGKVVRLNETGITYGTVKSRETALVIGDVARHDEGISEAVSILKQAGLRVFDVLVVIDCEEKVGVRPGGYHLRSLFTRSELLAFYTTTGKITIAMYDAIVDNLEKASEVAA